MASSPEADSQVCFHCESPSENFFPGWPLRNGGYAMLCARCGAAFAGGTFCDTFHPKASGWRNCASCKKRIHCGCIMAAHTFSILDFGGVKCAECSINEVLALHPFSPSLGSPEAMQHNVGSPEKSSLESQQAVTGGKSDSFTPVVDINSGADPILSQDSVDVLPNKIAIPTIPGAAFPVTSPLSEIGEESSVNTPDQTNSSRQKNGGKRRRRRNACKQAVQSRSKSNLIPLFEKEMTASDADLRNGRLVLPKRCAEAYFPKISGVQGIFLMVQDTRGNNWELYYRFWSNTNGKMYVLEGLKDYILLMKCQAGDKVTFYKREPDGKFVMGLKKGEAGKSDEKVWHAN
ncbi:hypothetical protein COLO4_09479 [Corchorus olitorius]|uniref:TF-B3 domain-containing protein n=1 Tax=Corchorus olitorius TaxID=93759 RepID=A0A1R3KBZ5_9ROSI|nr:hypothetical protein COLO4_09479 [Corchorus olitorius]